MRNFIATITQPTGEVKTIVSDLDDPMHMGELTEDQAMEVSILDLSRWCLEGRWRRFKVQ